MYKMYVSSSLAHCNSRPLPPFDWVVKCWKEMLFSGWFYAVQCCRYANTIAWNKVCGCVWVSLCVWPNKLQNPSISTKKSATATPTHNRRYKIYIYHTTEQKKWGGKKMNKIFILHNKWMEIRANKYFRLWLLRSVFPLAHTLGRIVVCCCWRDCERHAEWEMKNPRMSERAAF